MPARCCAHRCSGGISRPPPMRSRCRSSSPRSAGAPAAATVLAPAVTPEIFTGLRVGFSLTLLGVIIGEMFASQRGLGFMIINGINTHDVPTMMAVILLIVAFAVTAGTLLLAADRRL